jgi:nicotinate-nucleotide--dimethylbenzimidazole phosphoribosyltransferase
MSLLHDTINRIRPLDPHAMAAARTRQDQLTKPQGALGRLEALSIQIAGITGDPRPRLRAPAVVVMAADHGIARQKVSAYPRDVTRQMVLNFLSGGAAINVLAHHVGARVVVVDVGVASELPETPGLLVRKVALGTNDLSVEPAMSRVQAQAALETGITVADALIDADVDVIATGDMGIGNTTAASAITAAITGRAVAEVTGRGTGIDDARLAHKIALIEQALARHHPDPTDGLQMLATVGGFEIGGLAGVMLGAAARQVPIVVDGFISGAAALVACTLAPTVQPYLIAAHRSVEQGHQAILLHLDMQPLLDLGMRLGEGTGAVLGVSLCQAACKVLDEMATFAEAGVTGQS